MSAIAPNDDDDYNPELASSTTSTAPSDNTAIINTKIDTDSDIPNDIATTTTTTPTGTDTIGDTNTATDAPIPSKPKSLNDHSAPIPTKPAKSVKFAENDIEIEIKPSHLEDYSENEDENDGETDGGNDEHRVKSEVKEEDTNDSPDDDQLQIVDDNKDFNYNPLSTISSLPSKPVQKINSNNSSSTTSVDYSNINVPLFNEVVQYFITSEYFNDSNFDKLSPREKESLILNSFQSKFNRSVNPSEVNLNFNATTSYNKSNLKSNDEEQLLVPINPYCRRPDLTLPMNNNEIFKFNEFKKDSEIYSKEFECLNFPSGSRLFVGNLAVNSLKISDVWRIFSQYGNVKAVNMKQGYGFVQFTDATSCKNAINGEQHVPLHNRLMHLEVSKTHEKHTNQNKLNQANPQTRERDRERERNRDRDRSPVRNAKSTSNNNKVRVIISIESDASFNHLLVNSLNEVGLECNVKHVDSTANDIPQDVISEAAYSGVCATVVTSRSELVNLFLFQRNQNDGAIKFDEYENISMESSINFILNQQSKDSTNTAVSSSVTSSGNNNNANERRNRDGRDNRRDRDRGDNRRDRERMERRRGGRENRRERDDYNQRHQNGNNNNNNSNYNAYNKYNNGNNNRNYNNHNNNNANNMRYSPRQQEAQKHLPPQIAPIDRYAYQQQPNFYNNNNVHGMNQNQMPPPNNYYNNNSNNNNNVASQLMNQLSSLDEGSLKAMLSMVNQQQHQQQHQQHQQQYQQPNTYNSPNQGNPNNAVNGLLAQLQNIVPGGNAPVPVPNANMFANPSAAAQQAPPGSTNSNGGNNNTDSEDTSKLFETLARLKNNM